LQTSAVEMMFSPQATHALNAFTMSLTQGWFGSFLIPM
jgi:hypothetical protein